MILPATLHIRRIGARLTMDAAIEGRILAHLIAFGRLVAMADDRELARVEFSSLKQIERGHYAVDFAPALIAMQGADFTVQLLSIGSTEGSTFTVPAGSSGVTIGCYVEGDGETEADSELGLAIRRSRNARNN